MYSVTHSCLLIRHWIILSFLICSVTIHVGIATKSNVEERKSESSRAESTRTPSDNGAAASGQGENIAGPSPNAASSSPDAAVNVPDNGGRAEGSVESDTVLSRSVSSLETYKKLFVQNRATQLSGIKALLQIGTNEQRYSLVQVLLKQLFKVLADAKHNLTLAAYTPGDAFPTNESTRNAYSKVLENTALFGDMVLRLPDAVHSVYDKDKEMQLLMAWSYSFSKESGVFEGVNKQLLHLMAQEIKLIPKEPNFINPFKEAERLQAESLKKKKVEPKPKKKIARGPRLRHSEL